jgi:hypothetical protein
VRRGGLLLLATGGGVSLTRAPHVRGDRESPYHAFGLLGTALSKKISVFQSSALKVVPISPNAS